MNFALGCAFTAEDLFDNFVYKKLSINCAQCEKVIGNRHRNFLVARVFRECYKLVIRDIIDRNVTFWLPLTGKCKCSMHMSRVQGRPFQKFRQTTKKWDSVDILKSGFCGYEIQFFMFGQRTPRVKNVYVQKSYREQINKNTNKGMAYGDGKIDTTLKDYLSQICEIFKGVKESDIKKILTFAWKSLYLLNSYGGDVVITNREFWSYIGKLRGSAYEHYIYYMQKLVTKIRIKYKRSRTQWDGYYYFGLNEEEYQQFIQSKGKSKSRKKTYHFENIFLYEILEECKVHEASKSYIFRVPYISKIKMKFYRKTADFRDIELIVKRKPLTFKDMLVSENKYEYV